ncbi:MAG: glycosyltransferase family 9 protein [Actinomycetota bacterium]
MGFGGALMWTALVRNLRRQRPDRKVVLVYGGRPSSDHDIYRHNPDIAAVVPRRHWSWQRFFTRGVVAVDQSLAAAQPIDGETPERLLYRTGRHTVAIACAAYGVPCETVQPRIELAADEVARASAVLAAAGLDGRPFLCIEPAGKDSFTPNKLWFPERWRQLAEKLAGTVTLVQLGLGGGDALPGAVDLRNRLSFRETAEVLRRARGLVTTMGGLVHLNKAVDGRAVVLVSGYEPEELATYADDINFYRSMDCSNCGLKTPCPIGRECMARIGVDDVEQACHRLLAS